MDRWCRSHRLFSGFCKDVGPFPQIRDIFLGVANQDLNVWGFILGSIDEQNGVVGSMRITRVNPKLKAIHFEPEVLNPTL